jgi:hypothetical protein
MAEHDDDREVRRWYRELAREEPPPKLDAAIRAKARAGAAARRRNWYMPVAAAAALALAIAVAVQVERPQPDPTVASAPLADLAASPEVREMRKQSSERREAMSAMIAETPEQSLERIAQLRREGRHEEADRALAGFRKRYPDFRIPAGTLEKVEKKN